ncbi:MAG TPA: class I SAM-dependent methyltransferase [Bdellovibrionota bacterium]|nr:class I SAM-dependent methyltransferase [Bdellovibrionota bacterium]
MEGYYSNYRSELMPFVPERLTRALDVGCGDGTFGMALKQSRPFEVWGIEPVAAAAKIAGSRLDRVIPEGVETAIPKLPDSHFDAVFFNDVLEHLIDPEAVLRAIRPKLLPNATLVASLPNVRYLPHLRDLLVRKDWKYADSGILDRTHVRFFTDKSARKMLESCGYEITRAEGINGLPIWKILPWTLLTFGSLRDTRYLQFAYQFRATSR